MKKRRFWGSAAAGALAGMVNGLFGAGGGMVFLPALSRLARPREEELFPTSVATILPLCLVSLTVYGLQSPLPWGQALPYLIGSALGGVSAGLWGKKIPTTVLHRFLGALILWGGIRNLC